MDFTVEVRVELKKGALDAEGETVKKALGLLGYPVEKVDTVKAYRLVVSADNKEKAAKLVGEASARLLANPVIQDYSVKVM